MSTDFTADFEYLNMTLKTVGCVENVKFLIDIKGIWHNRIPSMTTSGLLINIKLYVNSK